MAWHPFNLDHRAHKLVLAARERNSDSLNQAYKMRATCAYGLERFWGEHLRLRKNEPTKAEFVKETWLEFVKIMKESRPDLVIPQVVLSAQHHESEIKSEAEKFWKILPTDQQECLSVLVSLCDAIVWWSQRLKLKKPPQLDQGEGATKANEDSLE